MRGVYLNRIVTRVPSHEVHGKFVGFVPRYIRNDRDRKLFARLIGKSQIESRYSVLKASAHPEQLDTESFYVPGQYPTTERRMALYEREAIRLAEPAVRELISRIQRESVTHLIVSTCTGFYAPGLDLDLQRRIGLRPDLERTMVGFMGCNAAINALKAAANVVRSTPDAKVLVVNLELCTIHLQEPQVSDAGPGARSETNFEQLLAFLQFADGCAASLVSSEPVGIRIDGFKAQVLPDSADLIQWRVGDTGFQMHLGLDVPLAIGQRLPSLMPELLTERERRETRLWALHPGGRSVIDSIQEKLALSDDEVAPSREVLRRYGNMSSATVMFVLSAMLEEARYSGRGLAMAFGPGLTVETMTFDKYVQ